MAFGTDQVLLYNVDPWAKLGFGVPSFGSVPATVNQPLWRLADEIGKVQLFLMTHVDVTRTRPPSRNTVERLGKTVNRVQTVLKGRAKEYKQLRLEPGHGSPSARPWNLHPVPYFPGSIVRNPWLEEYNELTMMALANVMQHTDNSLPLTITAEGAADIWQYFREVKRLLAMELLLLPDAAVIDDEAFQFSPAHYDAYDPSKVTLRVEAIDRPVSPTVQFTEADVAPLYTGIPANLIVANLARYPVDSVGDVFTGARNNEPVPGSSSPGTEGGTAIAPVLAPVT
jgi:hypothetical protein